MTFRDRINDLLAALRYNNPYGDASVVFADKDVEQYLTEPSDTHDFLIVVKYDAVDGEFSKIPGACSTYLMNARIKLIANCYNCSRERVVNWMVAKSTGIAGVRALSWSVDSESIYQQETGSLLQLDLFLARITIRITGLVPDFCSTELCPPRLSCVEGNCIEFGCITPDLC